MKKLKEIIPEEPPKESIYKSEKAKRLTEGSEFSPITNAKQTVEVIEKPRLKLEEIEVIEKPKSRENKSKRESYSKGIKNGKRQETKLDGNSILIITEKPQAALKISSALSGGKERKYSENGIPFYEFKKNGENVIVACAVGHLFSLSQDVKGSDYPIFEVSWKPNFEVRKKDFTRKYYNALSKLVKRAKEIIIATDYDVEGEVIGYNIVRFIANQKDAKRMKFSSLTSDELEESYKKVNLTIDWGQAIAGETRHFIDWYYGINLSRALMNSIKTTGKFKIMSIGRVQGPALNMIVEKEKEILAFKPIPFWRVFIEVIDKEKRRLKLKYIKDIFAEKELKKFENLKGKEADAKTEKTQQTIIPPVPFDLTTLQTEAYKFFYIVPSKTLQIAQQLYLAGLISYPRTSSQKIPAAINPKEILKKLSNHFPQTKIATRENPIEGKKSDPAHPSIYPTGEFQQLSEDEKKIYELIVKRFISCFSPDAKIENKTITVSINELLFKERGLEIKEKGWMNVYDARLNEKELEDMNGKVKIEKVESEKDETKPPRRFSPASIISELEKRGLGTKATRANIIETLYDRNYITDNKSIRATSLGISLIDTLNKHSPIIIDEKLTKDMEKDMDHIRESKKDLQKKEEEILEKARTLLKQISEDFHKKEKIIGEDLIKATQEFWKQENFDNEIGECPACHKGKLTIKFSPKNKKHFVACNAYPNCKTTFSLPPFGMIKKLGENKICDKCGFPLLMCLRKGKKPWIFCFNPQCPSRQEGASAPKSHQEEDSSGVEGESNDESSEE
jgi:DNA topoisomerase-1